MKSLTQLCLDRIVEALSAGDVIDLSNAFPAVRQMVLNEYLEHDKKYYRCGETASSAFSDVGFLDNMPSLDMRKGVTDDGSVLDGFIVSIVKQPSVVENLTELRLNLHVVLQWAYIVHVIRSNDARFEVIKDTGPKISYAAIIINCTQVTTVLKHCHMLNSLAFYSVTTFIEKCSQWEPCHCRYAIVNDFVDLSTCFEEIAQYQHIRQLKRLHLDYAIIGLDVPRSLCHMRQLCELTLEIYSVNADDWKRLLENCRETLQVVVMKHNSVGVEILPISLPLLRHFRTEAPHIICTELFAKNVHLCPQLQSLSFSLNGKEDADVLHSLSSLSIIYDLSMHINDDDDALSKIATLFGDRIESASIIFDKSNKLMLATRTFVSSCRNLKSLHVTDINNDVAAEFAPIFLDINRAEKLVNVRIASDIPEPLVDALFQNCTNLETVSLLLGHLARRRSVSDMVANPRTFHFNRRDPDGYEPYEADSDDSQLEDYFLFLARSRVAEQLV